LQLGVVTNVNDTFAFLWSDDYGQVFLPGGAYQALPDEPPRLSVNLSPGDVLLYSARPQSEHNGCSWLALSAAKYNGSGSVDHHTQMGQLTEKSTVMNGESVEGDWTNTNRLTVKEEVVQAMR
jgi:hypothetical protein